LGASGGTSSPRRAAQLRGLRGRNGKIGEWNVAAEYPSFGRSAALASDYLHYAATRLLSTVKLGHDFC